MVIMARGFANGRVLTTTTVTATTEHGVAQHGGHPSNDRLAETCSLFDIVHRLTKVSAVSRDISRAQGHVFFGSCPLAKCWFSIGSRADIG